MPITASQARKSLFPLIKKVNEDHETIEIVSEQCNAVLAGGCSARSGPGIVALHHKSWLPAGCGTPVRGP